MAVDRADLQGDRRALGWALELLAGSLIGSKASQGVAVGG